MKAELEALKELVAEENIEASLEKAKEKAATVSKVLNDNLKTAFDQTRDLEKSYRLMGSLFQKC